MLRWTARRQVTGPITSVNNPLVKEVAQLRRTRRRRETGLILIEGPQLAAEALAAGVTIDVGFTTEPAVHPDAIEVSGAVLARLSTTVTPNSLVIVADRPSRSPGDGRDLAVLWDVAEPGNVGALIRSAAAFGFDVVVAGQGAADPWSPKALRAGAGGHFHTAIRIASALTVEDLHHLGFTTVATVPHAEQASDMGEHPTALLIGSEAHGLPRAVFEAAGRRWAIPTEGVESLNAAVAGAIAMYELSRGR
jgi:TrmH family RNA methyltransferase